jgi:hypothetical protein
VRPIDETEAAPHDRVQPDVKRMSFWFTQDAIRGTRTARAVNILT